MLSAGEPLLSRIRTHTPVYEIRTLDSVPDLISAYRLRYDVYTAMGYVQQPNKAGLEIDAYDANSLPFGAFDSSTGLLIGTLRLVTCDIQSRYAKLISQIVDSTGDSDLANQARERLPHRLPSIVSKAIDQQIAAFNNENYEVCELSRTIVHPNYRGSGVSRELMEFGLAQASRAAPAVLIGSCLVDHLALYSRYGYTRVPQTGLEHFSSVGKTAVACICRTDQLPEPTRTHVHELVLHLKSETQNKAGIKTWKPQI